MLLDISNIGPGRLAVETELDLSPLSLDGGQSVRLSRVRLGLSVGPGRQGLELEGRLSCQATLTCARCLAAFELPLAREFRLTLVRRSPADSADEEGRGAHHVMEDEVDRFPFEGDTVDVDTMVREQVDLCLPMKPVCRPDCRGLCAQCGADLNEGPCACPEPPADPRWEALAGWRGSQARS